MPSTTEEEQNSDRSKSGYSTIRSCLAFRRGGISSIFLFLLLNSSYYYSKTKPTFLSSPIIGFSDAAMSTTKIYIVYYSLYGHVEIMARQVQQGANAVEGVEAILWQIRPEQLLDADGFIFGFPSRFGVMAAQFKAFFDATHEIWATQALAGKPAGIFWSTGFHGGGQERTALTAVTQLAHHGMIFVPLGYTFGSGMFEMNEVRVDLLMELELMREMDLVSPQSSNSNRPFIRVST
ncbi:putative NAD(P)H dehydrogenase (quinone) FQR1-like 3 [Camellia lanceoleosa]|nr:putative NAD(P)H dehydrogenase (quinone) FQR1-like 3 [Camellia lanceoleosa]